MGSGASKARAAQNEALLEAGTKASLSTAPNSEAQWYWSSADQKQHGPCTIAELQAIVATGGAAAPALVWRPGWERYPDGQSRERLLHQRLPAAGAEDQGEVDVGPQDYSARPGSSRGL